MSKQIKALKMAIKALQNIAKSLTEKQVWFSSDVYEALNACKEALEQPTTQEPVLKEGMRVRGKNTAEFHRGAKGVIKSIDLRIWVLRDGANSPVYYDEDELEIEVQDD